MKFFFTPQAPLGFSVRKNFQENVWGKQCTTSCQLTQTKFSFLVKSINFWSYLKVYTGIKEKKLKKKFFQHGEKKFSDLQNFSDKVNFRKIPFKMVKIDSDDTRHRHVMATCSADTHKSKIWGYVHVLCCAASIRSEWKKKWLLPRLEHLTLRLQSQHLDHSAIKARLLHTEIHVNKNNATSLG